jgi:hypothetical protein
MTRSRTVTATRFLHQLLVVQPKCRNEEEAVQWKEVYKKFFEDSNGDRTKPVSLRENIRSTSGRPRNFTKRDQLRSPLFRWLMKIFHVWLVSPSRDTRMINFCSCVGSLINLCKERIYCSYRSCYLIRGYQSKESSTLVHVLVDSSIYVCIHKARGKISVNQNYTAKKEKKKAQKEDSLTLISRQNLSKLE